MIAVIQRVKSAVVLADGEESGRCGPGLLVLLGVAVGDTAEDSRLLADKIAHLRIFSDADGKMNRSVLDVGGEALVVSNFTLHADYTHGNRPSYFGAARPEEAEPLYEDFLSRMEARLPSVGHGLFGADMEITMKADGPVTIVMNSADLRKGKAT